MNKLENNKEERRVEITLFRSRYLGLVIGLICVFITITLWKSSEADSLAKLSDNVESVTDIYVNKVEGRIDSVYFSLNELASDGIPNNLHEEEDWDMHAEFYIRYQTGIENIVWVDRNLIVRRVSPAENTEYIVGMELNSGESNSEYSNILLPIYNEDVFAGFILGNINVPRLILSVGFESENSYMIQVFDGNQLLASSDNWQQSKSSISAKRDITFKSCTYSFVLTPTKETISQSTDSSYLILVFGLSLSVLVSVVWYSTTVFSNRLEGLVVDKTKELNTTITDLKKKESELEYAANNDFLSGIYNRRYYEENLLKLDIEENYPLTIIMADINGLKLINDAFGHKSGDVLLVSAANIMSDFCRENDLLARIGGDEFVIILPNTNETKAEEIINNINKKAKEIKIESISLSISFGYKIKYDGKEDIQEVFRSAEDSMYRQKLIEIPSMRSGAIETILSTLYEKDEKSEIHSRSVSNISERLAKAYGMNRQDVSEVKTAGLLHDIGKIIISEKILKKEGKLTLEEYEIMKTHSEIGFRILNSASNMRGISNVVLNHHEKFDGSGYPRGIKSDEIPIKARIISIADAFDAMISERTYREIISKEEALFEIIRNSGTQFDPKLVDVFKNNFEKIVKGI